MCGRYWIDDGRESIELREIIEAVKFTDGMRQRRCAVPATHYFEWERAGKTKTKYAIRPADGALFYMAGIYRFESGRPVFSILTREPAERIAFIHDRMPVILPPDLVREWIDPRYRAGEILNHAILDLSHERAEGAEQIRMTL